MQAMSKNSLNLPVLPLNTLENLVTQKCLIPNTVSNFRPGSWVRCKFKDGSFVVCQLFTRTLLANTKCCFLDGSVVSGKLNIEEKLLESLELLSEETITEVHVSFRIISNKMVETSSKLNRDLLISLAQEILQSFKLVSHCELHCAELLQMGIDAIIINAKSLSNQAYFSIEQDTSLILDDIQLSNEYFSKRNEFYSMVCENAMKELVNILELTKMQRLPSHKTVMRFSLNAMIVGASGSGKSSLLAEFVQSNQCNCFIVAITNVMGQYPGETELKLRNIFKAACIFESKFKPKAPTVIILEDLHLLCPAVKSSAASTGDAANSMRICAQLVALLDDLHKSKHNIMCLATTSTPEQLNQLLRRSGRLDKDIVIPQLSVRIRKDFCELLFKEALTDIPCCEILSSDLLDSLAAQTQGYVAADLILLVRNVMETLIRNKEINIEEATSRALKVFTPTAIRSTDVTVLKVDQDFNSLGGMFNLKRQLQVSVLAGLKQQAAFARFGLSLPKGILLYGPPGCAKTCIAKCLAAEAKMTFIATSGAEVYSPYVGCAEKFIAKIFDTARKNAPCLIFLDEIDSLVGKRCLSSNSSQDVQLRILSTLLTEMDGILGSSGLKNLENTLEHILVVAATNRPDMLDDALMRPGRFDKLIHVPAPDYDSRLAILQLQSKRMPFASCIDLSAIAQQTQNYSGADLCNLCNEAAIEALQRNFDTEVIEREDFEKVLNVHKSSLTKQQIQQYIDFEKRLMS